MARLHIIAAVLFGGGSLLLLGLFLVAGSWELVPLDWPLPAALALDTLLSLLFFVQHSGMVRRGFRRRLGARVPAALHPAVYASSSGLALLPLLILWQRSEVVVWSLAGPARWLTWLACAAALLIGWWGVRVLGSFDPLGTAAARAATGGASADAGPPFTVRGPYRWVRHPLYAAALVLFWAHPHLTLDRLLFALLWTAWVVLAARWEERDLTDRFGAAYRRYRQRVPMLLPRRAPWTGADRP